AAAAGFSIAKNNQAIEIMGGKGKVLRERIPDFFSAGSVVGDVKMVKAQSYDEQLRDDYRIATADNCRIKGQTKLLTTKCQFNVVVSGPNDQYPTGTQVYDPVFTACQATGGDVWEITE